MGHRGSLRGCAVNLFKIITVLYAVMCVYGPSHLISLLTALLGLVFSFSLAALLCMCLSLDTLEPIGHNLSPAHFIWTLESFSRGQHVM